MNARLVAAYFRHTEGRAALAAIQEAFDRTPAGTEWVDFFAAALADLIEDELT